MGIAPRLESGEKLQEVLREKFNRMAEEVEALGRLESDSGLIAIDDMGSGKVIRWTGPRYFDAGGGSAGGYAGPFAVRAEAVEEESSGESGGAGAAKRFKATVYDSANPSATHAGRIRVRLPGASGSTVAGVRAGIVPETDEDGWISEDSETTEEAAFADVAGKRIYLIARVFRDFDEGLWRVETRFEAASNEDLLSCHGADETTCWTELASVDSEGNVEQRHLYGDIAWNVEGAFGTFRVLCRNGTAVVFDAGSPSSGEAGRIAIGSTAYYVDVREFGDAPGKEIHLTVRAAEEDETAEGLTSDGKYVIAIEAVAGTGDLSTYGNPAAWSRRLATIDANGSVRQVHQGGDLEIPTARWT